MTRHNAPADAEFREHSGMRALAAERDAGGRRTQTRVRIVCPFCGGDVDAYRWSLAGSGKRCDCGAVLGQFGAWKQEKGKR